MTIRGMIGRMLKRIRGNSNASESVPPAAIATTEGETEHAHDADVLSRQRDSRISADTQERASTVSRGSTQFPRRKAGEALDVVIGFDFGTSSSKVIIRTPFMQGRRAIAIPFGTLGHEQVPYLLPSTLYRMPDGSFSLKSEGSSEAFSEIKVRMLEPAGDSDVVALAASYLALAIREARFWFLTTQAKHYSRFHLRWALNLGIPSAGYDDERIRQCFGQSARAAWHLSTTSGPIDDRSAHAAVHHVDKGKYEAPIPIDVIPEVAAEVVGYARSPLRRQGLHVIVDVGASTLDICSFILHEEEGEDQYPLLTALVERLGTLALHHRRLDALGDESASDVVQSLDPGDALTLWPESAIRYARKSSRRRDQLRSADRDHVRACRQLLMKTIVDLKTRRHPLSSCWKDGLPVFLCGGGSRMRCFRDVIDKTQVYMCGNRVGRGIIMRQLPNQSDLVNEDIQDRLFDRLAVAYGLSFDSLDIGEISPPYEIGDVAPPRVRGYERGFVSKDQV